MKIHVRVFLKTSNQVKNYGKSEIFGYSERDHPKKLTSRFLVDNNIGKWCFALFSNLGKRKNYLA